MSGSLPPIPSQEAFIAALTTSLEKKKTEDSSSLQLVKATVFEKTGRRGSAYVDCNSVEAAAKIVEICNEFPPQFLESSNVDAFFVAKQPLVVSQKIDHKTQQATGTLLVTYAGNNNNNEKKHNSNQQESVDVAAPVHTKKEVPSTENTNNSNNNNTVVDPTMTVAPTLYLRCKKFFRIHHVFDFFRNNNITGHADDCVFCSTSKKPYFLVDWGKNVQSYQNCLFLDGMKFQGEDVSIKVSTQSAADYKEKKPESLSLAGNREKKIRQREAAVEEATDFLNGGSMVPISVLMNNPSAAAAVQEQNQPGPEKPPQP